MISRCHNPKDKSYPRYGARGIRVCDRWRDSMVAFIDDMGPKPPGASIERIDNDGDYCPENCCWASAKQQNRNKRTNHFIEFNGRRLCVQDWASELGLTPSALLHRLKIMPIEKALTIRAKFRIKRASARSGAAVVFVAK
jgi:hypothetical protein